MKLLLFLTLPLYVLDQVTKYLVLRFIEPQEAHVIVPDFLFSGFEIVQVA